MCGIAGCIDWERDFSQACPELDLMAGTLGHRGPDASGTWLSTRAALAHRRLFVIDPAGGSQPMVYSSGNRICALVFNGEIFNFRELRGELEAAGHRFHTKSDTEVLLHSYLEWGEDSVRRLNGIFAFAIWDEQRQRLFIARDHLGVKPLYYAVRGSTILFGSELKALLAHPLVNAEVDAEGLGEIFGAGPIRTPGFATYRNVEEVPPAHFIRFERHGKTAVKYWSLRSAPHMDDLETTTERVRALLDDTVRRQLIADVPVVTMLSGGLDSSGISALAAKEFKNRGERLNTYAIDFVGSGKDFQADSMRFSLDAPWAERVSEFLDTQHHTVTVDARSLLDNFDVATSAYDLPGLGQLDTSLFLLCSAMKKNATVALSGESADEIFAGYPWCHNAETLRTACFPWMVTLGTAAAGQYSYFWLSSEMREKVRPQDYVKRRYEEALAEVPRLEGEDPVSARRREIVYLNLTHWLSMLLDRKDRMSMATGFEIRVPFCDYRLIEYVWNVSWEMKTADDTEKGLLRRALSGLLPDDVRQRRKSAYPVSTDPEYAAGIRERALAIFNSPSEPVLPFLNLPAVKSIATGRMPGFPARFTTLMLERLIQLNNWLAKYQVQVC